MENKKTAVLKIKYADIIMGVLFVALAAWIFWVCRSAGLDFYHDNAPRTRLYADDISCHDSRMRGRHHGESCHGAAEERSRG